MLDLLPRKTLFNLPDDVIYLDGNSLGPLPAAVPERVANVISKQWGTQLIRGWNESQWMELPGRIGDTIATLIGAKKGTVVMGDTLSIKVYQALCAALKMNPGRRVILSDAGNFPTDLYMAQGLIELLDKGYSLKLVEPHEVMQSIDESIAVVMLTQVDYRTGRLHDMQAITSATHAAGAISIWDLAHSAGALPIQLDECECEYAVGCTYKYLNGGPGAPAFIYVRPDLISSSAPSLAGWLGHESPFAFDKSYTPAQSIERMRVGTPPVLQLAALEAALGVWEGIDLASIREASIRLSQLFIAEVEARCPELRLASPREPELRGSQVSFSFDRGYAVVQALIAHNVIGDFRAPDIMRFGFTPLYLEDADIIVAVDRLEKILKQKIWAQPEFQVRKAVT
ncbi:MAG: kynureninase [Granulosicoccus sp.]